MLRLVLLLLLGGIANGYWCHGYWWNVPPDSEEVCGRESCRQYELCLIDVPEAQVLCPLNTYRGTAGGDCIAVPEAQVLCPLNEYRETVGGDCIDVPETQVLCPLNKYRETVGGDCIDVPEPQVLCPLNKYRETAGGNCIDVPGAACGTFAEKLSDYRGTISVTETEKTCQKWTDQWPHSHSYTPENKELMGLGDHNYCRNPSPPGERAWCYTTDRNKRWEYCDVPECYEESASQENVDEGSLSIILPVVIGAVFLAAGVYAVARKRKTAVAQRRMSHRAASMPSVVAE